MRLNPKALMFHAYVLVFVILFAIVFGWEWALIPLAVGVVVLMANE